jgi:hypothetical protein
MWNADLRRDSVTGALRKQAKQPRDIEFAEGNVFALSLEILGC